MSEVVEMKPKAKPKAKNKKAKVAAKKVARGLKQAIEIATTPEEIDRLEAKIKARQDGVTVKNYTPTPHDEHVGKPGDNCDVCFEKIPEQQEAKATPSLEQVERDIAAFYAGAQPLKYGFFERAFDNLRFVAAYLNRRVPRLVWVGQRIDIDVRWDQTKNAITVHYRGPFKKVK